MKFPDAVRSDMGYALGVAQLGGKHPGAKPWKGQGPGVLEVVERHEGNAYRAIYTVRFAGPSMCSCIPEEISLGHSHGAKGHRPCP